MKKKILFSFIIFFFVLLLLYLFYPIAINISFIPYEAEFLYPRGLDDITSAPMEYTIKNIDYYSVCHKLNNLEEITEIVYDNTPLKLDYIFTENGIIPLNLMDNDDEASKMERKLLTDRDINIRYCIAFPKGKKIHHLYLGCNNSIIMIDNKFYRIQREKYKELLFFFANILGDEIKEDFCF